MTGGVASMEEMYEAAVKKGYTMGFTDAILTLAKMAEADGTADMIAAESRPMGRRSGGILSRKKDVGE